MTPTLPQLPFLVSPAALWLVWGVAVVGWIVASGLLLYLWRSYGTSDYRIRRMRIIYFIGSAVLLASAASFIFSL